MSFRSIHYGINLSKALNLKGNIATELQTINTDSDIT